MKYLNTYKLFESGTIEFYLDENSFSPQEEDSIRDILLPLTDNNFSIDISCIHDPRNELIYIIEIFTMNPSIKFNILDIYDDINFLVNYMVNNLGLRFFGYSARIADTYINMPNINGVLDNKDLFLARIPNLTKLYVKFKNSPQLDIDDV